MSSLRSIEALLAGLTPALAPERLNRRQINTVVDALTTIERRARGARLVLRKAAADTGQWKRTGARSPADHIARQEGITIGQAKAELTASERLAGQPEARSAAASGDLSVEKAKAVAEATAADPTAEADLVAAARTGDLAATRDAARGVISRADERAGRHREAIYRRRSLRTWLTLDGEGHGHWNIPADMHARFLAALEPYRHQAIRNANDNGQTLNHEALMADALDLLARDIILDHQPEQPGSSPAQPPRAARQEAPAPPPAHPGSPTPATTPPATSTPATSTPATSTPATSTPAAQRSTSSAPEPSIVTASPPPSPPVRPASPPNASTSARPSQPPAGDSPSTHRNRPTPPDHLRTNDHCEPIDGSPAAAERRPDQRQPDRHRPDLVDEAPLTDSPDASHPAAPATPSPEPPAPGGAPTLWPDTDRIQTQQDAHPPDPRWTSNAGSATEHDAAATGSPVNQRRQARRAPAQVHVLVDYDALLRGHALDGETTEITGLGPVPVSLVRQMMADSLLQLIVTGTDITAITSQRRYIPAKIRTALIARDRGRCVVPGCSATKGLEIDHCHNDYAKGGPTALHNLALLCRNHHTLKSTCGWTLTGNHDTGWTFTPPHHRPDDEPP